MRATDLALLYLLVGLGSSAAVLARGRAQAGQRAVDAALVLAFWPLYGPFLLMGSAPPETKPATLVAIATNGMAALTERIHAAEHKLAEIDGILARPELSEAAARQREQELRAAGDPVGEKLAQSRVQAILRIVELRRRFARELDQVRELMLQLRVQGELVKLAGDGDGGNRELLAELTVKVECLDEIVRTGLDPTLA